MKFKSPNKTPIRVASTHGHIAIVGPEWKELPEVLHGEAIARGCVCDQEIVQPVDPTADPYGPPGPGAVVTGGERAHIKAALKSMLMDRRERPHVPMKGEGNEKFDARFTPDNLPRAEYVSQIAGITVGKSDVLAVWDEMRAEAEAFPTEPVKTGQEKAREAGAKSAAKKAASA
jgi:hypothetical protein